MEKELQDVLNVIVKRFDKIDSRLEQIDRRFDQVDKRFDKVELRLDSMESRQDEMFQVIRALEENVKVTRAEQEKMAYVLADVQGKVNMLTEEVHDHEKVINQIRAIK